MPTARGGASRPAPMTPEDADWARRKRQLLTAGGVIAVVAVIAAAVFWYTGSGGGTTRTAPASPLVVTAGDHALVLGPATAPHTVVVHEDFGDPASAAWDRATRDFLKADAAAGLVRVEYLPFAQRATGYGAQAAIAFGAALTGSGAHGAEHALALHGRLFDHQGDTPAPTSAEIAGWASGAGSAVAQALQAGDRTWVRQADALAAKAGVRQVPVVLLDGRPLAGAGTTARADALERALAS